MTTHVPSLDLRPRVEPAGVLRPGSRGRAAAPLVWSVLGLTLWVWSLARVRTGAMTDLGLVSVLPWTGAAALGLITLGLVHALLQPAPARGVLLAHPLALCAALYVTPPLLYEGPRFSWAWKHAGIVDYIMRTGDVAPRIDVLPVYHNWPGFFSANALLTQLAGLDSPLSYAAWAELLLNLLATGAVVGLLGCFTGDPRTVTLGAWVFVLGNWVGQGYFSPQGVGYVWYLAILCVVLRWFPRGRPAHAASPAERAGLAAVLLLILVALAGSHQITPPMTIITLTALVVARRTTARTLPVFMAVLTGAWVLYVATPFAADALAETLAQVGAVDSNLDGALIGYGAVSREQVVVSLVTRGLALAVSGLAGVGVLRLLRRRDLDVVPVVVAAAPLLLVVLSAYGSEILFRAYLFSLPGLAFFAGVALWTPATRPSFWRVAMVGVVSVALTAGCLVALFGSDRRYHFTPGEIAAARYVYETAPPGSLLIEGARNYPAQFRHYERFTYVPIARESPREVERIVANPARVLGEWMADRDRFAAAYVIITRSQVAETTALGELPRGGLRDVRAALSRSPRFEAVLRNRDAVVFVLRDHRSVGR